MRPGIHGNMNQSAMGNAKEAIAKFMKKGLTSVNPNGQQRINIKKKTKIRYISRSTKKKLTTGKTKRYNSVNQSCMCYV